MLRLLSLNARGLVTPTKRDRFLHELSRLNFDLFLIQETHVSCKRQADDFSRNWPGECFWSFGRGRSSGVGLLVSPTFQGSVSRFVFDSDGRIISALVLLGPHRINVVNIYAPNTVSERKTFFHELHNFFLSPVRIIAGDFNCVDNLLDRLSRSNVSLPDKAVFQALLADNSLIDIWRKRNPTGVSYTWANPSHTQASRIDRFLISRAFVSHVSASDVLPCVFSDHDFISLNLSLDNFSCPRNGIWKFNCSLLSDTCFKNEMSNFIREQKQRFACFESLGAWWDHLKSGIRNFCINFCSQKRKLANRERNRLTNCLISAKRRFVNGASSAASEIRNLESALASLVSREAEGAMIRSRAKWFEEGEKPTRYFFRLEKKRAEKNSFDCLLDAAGVEKTAQDDIESILVDFYKNLFTKDVLDLHIQSELLDGLDFSLSDSERLSCEGEFTEDELLTALNGLQTGKSPGSDGLPTEFYLAFWEDLGGVLTRVLNEDYRSGSLTDSQREGLLRLVYKRDDKRLPKNWRPISLLNTDYKIASKAITERLKPVMHSIVHRDQTCGVVGRSIFSNLQLIRDTLDMICKTDETGILITLDQEKAFDRVDHSFLMRVLSSFGFGPSFCKWFSLFYHNVFSRVICNGRLSAPISLERGVRQGCPLSPLLYVLVSEVLSTQVRKCDEVVGFRLPGAAGLQFKISQYADDATIFVKTETSLFHVLRMVNKYERASGARLNASKTEAMWLGSWRSNGASPFGLKWVPKLKILGIFFSNGLVSVESDNWRSKLDKLETKLNLWKQRELSFAGRALIVNVLGASRFWHTAKILLPPRWVYDRYRKIIWPFIWRGKMENVSRQRCCAPLKLGGLNVVDFLSKCTSLRLSCFASLRDNFGDQKWHYLARYFLGNRLAKLDVRFSFASISVPVSSEPSLFYRKCLSALQDVFDRHGSLPDDLSCRKIYSLLVDFPSAPPRCAGFWDAIVGRPINRWASVWRKSRLKIIENRKCDVLWLLLHNGVRVRYNLKQWGYIRSDACAVCSRPETPKHCFIECRRIVRVWRHFSPLLSSLLGSSFVLSFPSVLFPLSTSSSCDSLLVSHYLIATILYFVWWARNLATFRNSTLDSASIINSIVKDVRLRVLGDSLATVKRFWSVNSVICSVNSSDKINFHF